MRLMDFASNKLTDIKCYSIGWGTMLQAGKVAGSIPDEVIGLSQLA
jgi:hypothetical protein